MHPKVILLLGLVLAVTATTVTADSGTCDTGPCDCECTCDPPVCTTPEPATTTTPEPTTTTTPVPTTTPLCTAEPRDIVFVLDKSGSIGDANWPILANFVADVIAGIPVSQADGHVGIVRYSGPYQIFKDFDMTLFDRARLEAGVRALPYKSTPQPYPFWTNPRLGATYTNLGLDAARDLLKAHARPGAPSKIVVVTDGKTTTPLETNVAVQACKAAGHEIIAVGIGSISLSDLSALATHGVLYKAPTFATLVDLTERLTGAVCA